MYVDAVYYKNTYKGMIVPDEVLDIRLVSASDQIDILTYNRINAAGFDKLTPFQQDKIKKAVCIQADFLHQYGDYVDLPVSSFSAGDISVNLGTGANNVNAPRAVINHLRQTGLTCRVL